MPTGIYNGNSYHAQRYFEEQSESFWEKLKADREERLLALQEEQHAVYLELLEADPEGGEAWFDDNENIPEFGSIRERIRLMRARIDYLKRGGK